MLTKPDMIVCRCESLTRTRISQEVEVGAASTNAVKSGLRAGMGPCGGKYRQTAIARFIAMHENRPEAEIPPSAPRPPLRPVPVSALSADFDYDDSSIPKLCAMTARYDIAVIGGGIAGVLTALRMAEGGMRATVLDQGDLGQGAQAQERWHA